MTYLAILKRAGSAEKNPSPNRDHADDAQIFFQNTQKNEFRCETCEISFQQKSNLMTYVHMVHLNIKRYACNLCNGCAAFHNSKNLRHIREVHFACEECSIHHMTGHTLLLFANQKK
jgi:hypothetical protein